MVFLALIIAYFRYRVNEKTVIQKKKEGRNLPFFINSTYISISNYLQSLQ